ncbi:MAG TPA: hypothetical protein VFH56_04925 [Acidimicrobiales bacterium]|nr:hypothetical protein [Acidimicrobiales bacterium]
MRFLGPCFLVALAVSGCQSGFGTGGAGSAGSTATAGVATTGPQDSTAATQGPVGSPISVLATGARCSYRRQDGYTLPDPGCTPGVTNPDVSQANIHSTICVRGWTSTVRPPESYTEKLKREQMDNYGDTGSMSGYEEDHLIPLELGGSPADPRNLWPQPGSSPNPKDDVEYAANRAVCGGGMPLAEAQREIAADWVTLGRSLGVLQSTN